MLQGGSDEQMHAESESDRERDRDDREKDNMDKSEMGGSKQKTFTNSKGTNYLHYYSNDKYFNHFS